MTQTSLYDDDILLWSEQQAEIIRSLGQSRRNLPNEFDLENVAEEIASVGRSEMASVESFLRLLLLHLIKVVSVPDSPAVPHWREEARNFAADALTRFSPSMEQRVDLARAWRLACSQARASLLEHGDRSVRLPEDCPFSIEELVSESLAIDPLVARLASESVAEGSPAVEPDDTP